MYFVPLAMIICRCGLAHLAELCKPSSGWAQEFSWAWWRETDSLWSVFWRRQPTSNPSSSLPFFLSFPLADQCSHLLSLSCYLIFKKRHTLLNSFSFQLPSSLSWCFCDTPFPPYSLLASFLLRLVRGSNLWASILGYGIEIDMPVKSFSCQIEEAQVQNNGYTQKKLK